MNYYEFCDIVARYPKEFKKTGVTASILADLEDRYVITEIYVNERAGRETETKTRTITAEQYANSITGISFFHDRVTKGYTFAGNIAVKLTAKNPYEKQTVTRYYKISKKAKEL